MFWWLTKLWLGIHFALDLLGLAILLLVVVGFVALWGYASLRGRMEARKKR